MTFLLNRAGPKLWKTMSHSPLLVCLILIRKLVMRIDHLTLYSTHTTANASRGIQEMYNALN
jgi:hypothetical protein